MRKNNIEILHPIKGVVFRDKDQVVVQGSGRDEQIEVAQKLSGLSKPGPFPAKHPADFIINRLAQVA
jgi:hypothetical protein